MYVYIINFPSFAALILFTLIWDFFQIQLYHYMIMANLGIKTLD